MLDWGVPRWVSVLLSLGLLGPVACKKSPPPDSQASTTVRRRAPTGPPPAPRDEDVEKVGVAYRFESDAGSGVLFGTIHLGARVGWPRLAPPVREAFMQAQTVVFEVNMTGAATKMSRAGNLPPGTSLRDLIAPETFATLVRESGQSAAVLDRQRPWYAAVNFLQAKSTGGSMDKFIRSEAIRHRKRVVYFETLDQQLDALSRGITAEDLDRWLGDLEQSEADRIALRNAYNASDVEGMRDVLAGESNSARTTRVLFTERNVRWLAELPQWLEPDQPVFVAVGAGHLVGIDNLVEGLAEQGFAVRQIHPEPANVAPAVDVGPM